MKKTRMHILGCVFIFYSSVVLATSQVGEPASEFSALTLDGREIALKSFKDKKAVYLKFWATWCHYCMAEMPLTQSLYEAYKDKLEFVLVNVGINDSVKNIDALFKKQNYTLPVVFDEKGELVTQYEIVGTPQHVLIDKHGKVIYRSFLMTDELQDLIKNIK